MSFIERYVTSAALGGGIGSEGNPWTLSQSLTTAVAGDRVNVKSDATYNLGSTTISNAGTFAQLIVWRGYNTTIGDLEGQGRNADETLNLTNFPSIVLTGTIISKNYITFEALNISGAVNNFLVGGAIANEVVFIQCNVLNTRSNSNARSVLVNNNSAFLNCDFECSGETHNAVARLDVSARVVGCRFKAADAVDCLPITSGTVTECVFMGNASAVGIALIGSGAAMIGACTFYAIGTCVTLPNLAMLANVIFYNNHPTDCSKWIDSLYSGTSDVAVIEVNNRTRDNATPRTGIGDGANIGEITTDTGGDETDYKDASSENFTLIPTAPGRAAGMVAHTDCGAYQRAGGTRSYTG